MQDVNQQSTNKDQIQQSAKATIIIKRIVAGGHAHHGGAWKVAYADFVTAMMAFFLLLWLLNSVPTEKLKGVAQYFEPTVGISGSKGIGFQGGKSQNEEGQSQFDKAQGVKYGVMSKGNIVSAPQSGTVINNDEAENESLTLVEGELKKVMVSNNELSQFQDSIQFAVTPEGLVIKIIDQDKYPMFKPGSAELETVTKNIISKIVNLIKYSPNFISISGHTDSDASNLQKNYSNWELSTDRANAARRFMVEQGMPIDQISRIVGRADAEPLDSSNPNSSRNRRIVITLLRNSIMPFNKISAPRQLLEPIESNNITGNTTGSQ